MYAKRILSGFFWYGLERETIVDQWLGSSSTSWCAGSDPRFGPSTAPKDSTASARITRRLFSISTLRPITLSTLLRRLSSPPRVMEQKFMLVALLSGTQSVRILLKLTVYLQIHLRINVSVLFRGHPAFVYLRMHWKNYLHFVFPLMEVANPYRKLLRLWCPLYLCLLQEKTEFCLLLTIVYFLWRLHQRMGSPMLIYRFSHWSSA